MNLNKVITPFINYSLQSTHDRKGKAFDSFVYIFPSEKYASFKKSVLEIVSIHATSAHQDLILKEPKLSVQFMGIFGPVWILFEPAMVKTDSHQGLLRISSYAWLRDQAGSLLNQIKLQKLKNISVTFKSTSSSLVQGFVVGAEMAAYNYLSLIQESKSNPIDITLTTSGKLTAKDISFFQKTATSLHFARHLTNLPPNELNPKSLEQGLKDISFSKSMSIDVWSTEKCKKENMNLLVAVGQGSENSARMIHLKYRPKNKTGSKVKNKKPIAFVGKGITFDTGGLDIKPSSGMRLMKKDMGGAAAVLALAYWVDATAYSRSCDFYLALAENSVDSKSMRPSDVYKSRAGYLVEIDNTDAEGRLVLADTLDVAVTPKDSKDMPEVVINIATLTGAIKVALGADIAGLFCNDDILANQLQNAGQLAGEPNWRMPLVQKYWSSLNSQFADFKNSADGFGGAITAALFLEKFVKQTKWAHLDVYCWTDKNTGAVPAGTATGQPVQTLIEWLLRVG